VTPASSVGLYAPTIQPNSPHIKAAEFGPGPPVGSERTRTNLSGCVELATEGLSRNIRWGFGPPYCNGIYADCRANKQGRERAREQSA
jgi:hypothetical protein